jgi:CubicO group peptidase (beta-lactamase class C family)
MKFLFYKNTPLLAIVAWLSVTLGHPQPAIAVDQQIHPKQATKSLCTWRGKRWKAASAKCTVMKKNKKPDYLKKDTNPSQLDKKIIEKSRVYMSESDGPLGLLLLKNGSIITEQYAGKGNKISKFAAYSVTKSLTSLAIGKAICNGLFNLNTPASKIVPEFQINNYGKSTVRQILMMSSGAYWTTFVGWGKLSNGGYGKRWAGGKLKGQPFKTPDRAISAGQLTLSEILWGKYWDYIEDKNVAKPGEYFVYKGLDSNALSKIVERASGMSLGAYFEKEVWQLIKPGQKAYWRADVEGSSMGNNGFNASLRDWGRLGLWILAERKKPGCFGDYLREATSKQIDNKKIDGSSVSGPTWKGYGYQFWVDNKFFHGFCGKGFAGQWFCFNPGTEKVAIKFAYKTTPGLSDIFNDWNAE